MDQRSDREIAESVGRVPLFADCSAAELRAISGAGRALRRKAGAEIVKESQGGVAFFLILDGTVEINRGGKVVGRLMAGDYFGEMAVMSGQPRSATATAVTDVELFTFTQWTFRGLLLANPNIAYKVLRTVAARASADTGIV
jgi:CRP-like cAMP-binding protein